jgi:hypothetical protein
MTVHRRTCLPRACIPRWARLVWLLIALGWLGWLVGQLVRLCRLANRDRDRPADGVVPPWAYRQPDPMIYSQQFLAAQGLAVTWDNPDIHVELASNPGVSVDAHALEPDTEYLVVARIWNGSTTAPALGMPVRITYLDFGVATTRHDVGTTKVDLPVKAATGCPAFATVPWRTPTPPGHYCLQVELLWDDDLNPANNMGQTNTDVKPLNSPHATFTFPVRNDGAERAVVMLAIDTYAIPPLEACDDDSAEHNGRSRLDRHRAEAWPIPAGWQLQVNPQLMVLLPGQQADVTVDVNAPDGFLGRQVFNVHASRGADLLGGVTLYVDGTG